MVLKFLVDVGVGIKVERWLSVDDHDVKTVRAIDPKLPDQIILQIASRESHIVVTMDKDFGEMVFRAKRSHAGVLQGLRHGGTPARLPLAYLLRPYLFPILLVQM
jgi:predicted nuclease of predicted toxin-antitoxin system